MEEGGAHKEGGEKDSTAHAGIVAIESEDWFLVGAN